MKRADKLSEIDTNNGPDRSIVKGVRLHLECEKLLIVFCIFYFFFFFLQMNGIEGKFGIFNIHFSLEINRYIS